MPEITQSPVTPSPEEVCIVIDGGTDEIMHRRSRRSDNARQPLQLALLPMKISLLR
ncbi:hypothetical protein TIFTF001_016793 [Ficus carica]|uniref:Uncharacterized protein n=1 Tax=Ficus carica TaxID=3494 RepID=A0AA88A858_FICCA|nr:hypothetical protein TIFTF001_016793 [Ficus carica]